MNKTDQKLKNYFLKEAIRDKKFAKEKINDKKWMNMASNCSKEMVIENLKKSKQEIANDKIQYLKLRASARGSLYGVKTYIDKEAREKFKKITGRFLR